MKAQLVLASLMAAACFPLFAQSTVVAEYPVELVRQISTGSSPGQIAYSDSPFGIASVYPMSYGEDGFIYINDWVNNCFDVFSSEMMFIRRIDYSKFSMGLMKTYKINRGGEIVGFQKGELIKVSPNGALIYSLDGDLVSKNIGETAQYFFYKDLVIFYDNDHKPKAISPLGKFLTEKEMRGLLEEMRKSGSLFNLPSISIRLKEFLDSNSLILIGDRLIASFEKYREFCQIIGTSTELPEQKEEPVLDFSGAKYISLAGFDAHNNSYWYISVPDHEFYAVFSRTGRLITQIRDNLHATLDNISPLGDIYKGDFIKKEKVYRFYRIKNVWDSIDQVSLISH